MVPPEMSHHSTRPMLCRASQADADWEITACPQAQEMIDYFTAVFECFVVGTVQLLRPNRDARGNTHCNTHLLPISLIPSFPHAIHFLHVPSLLYSCSLCLQEPVPVCSQVSSPYLKRSPKSYHPGVFAITGCVATSQLLSETCSLMSSSPDCWLSI